MALFPMFVDIEGKYCLVIGGGKVALRKIRTLLEASADVHVWSEHMCDEVMELFREEKVVIEDRCESIEGLMKKAFLVVCATDDRGFNHNVCLLCKKHHVHVNSATHVSETSDVFDDSSFIFPSYIVRDGISVGISTAPAAPTLSKHIRKEIESILPKWYGLLGMNLAEERERLRSLMDSQEERAAVMARLTAYGLSHEGEIPKELLYQYISEEKRRETAGEKR